MKPTSLPHLFAALFATLTLGVTAPACSTYIDEAIAPSMWSSALCKARLACGCTEVSKESEEECRVQERHSFEQQRAFAREMGLSYDADCLSRQIEGLKTLGCDPLLSGLELCAMQQCSIYHSEFGPVSFCSSTAELGNDTCSQGGPCLEKPGGNGACNPACAFSDAEHTGIELPPTVADGQRCFDQSGFEPVGQCGPSSFCDIFNTDRCQPLSGVGSSCEHNGFCASDAFCDISSSPKSLVCKARKADGAACSRSEECAHASCENSVCAPAPAAVCLAVPRTF